MNEIEELIKDNAELVAEKKDTEPFADKTEVEKDAAAARAAIELCRVTSRADCDKSWALHVADLPKVSGPARIIIDEHWGTPDNCPALCDLDEMYFYNHDCENEDAIFYRSSMNADIIDEFRLCEPEYYSDTYANYAIKYGELWHK